MANDFLSGLGLGDRSQNDFASPLQVEIAKLLMAQSAPKQMDYNPNIPGGWSSSLVNAVGNINSAMYKNQALRVNEGLIGDTARAAKNTAIRPQDRQPVIGNPVVMKEKHQIDPLSQIKPFNTDVHPATPPDTEGRMNLGMGIDAGDWGALTIKDGTDQTAPYMGRARDIKNTKRIVFHGDTKENVDDIVDAKGRVNQGLLNYGRSVDKSRGFDPNYHYYIDREGNITSGVPLDKSANHAGKFNKDSIGIVLAGVIGGKQPTDKQRAAAERLAEKLAGQFGLAQTDVVSHPELMPGHREKSEAADVAAFIRNNGFKGVAGELPPVDMAEGPRPPLSRGGLSPEQLAVSRFAKPQMAPMGQMALGGPPPAVKPPEVVANPPAPSPWSYAVQQAQEEKEAIEEEKRLREQQPQIPPTQEQVPPPNNVGQSSQLGGPITDAPITTGSVPGQRVAQMQPDRTGRPAVPQDGNFTNKVPGYNGPMPNLPSLPSEKAISDRIDSLSRMGGIEAVNEYVEQLQKDMMPVIMKVPNGELHVTRKHHPEKNEVVFIPTATESTIDGVPMSTQFGPDGKLNYNLKVPGKADGAGDLRGYEEFKNWQQRLKAEGEATSELYGDKAAGVSEAITKGTGANTAIQTLNTMDALSKAGGAWTPRGPTKDMSLKMRQFLANVGLPVKETELAEVFDKFNNFLASQATQAITSRGTNFDLQTFMRANPSLLQSKEGTEMLINIMQQEYKAIQSIGRRANQLSGKDVDKLPVIIEEYYRHNPIKFQYKGTTVTTKPIKNRDDLEDVPSGHGYIAPDGTVRVKP